MDKPGQFVLLNSVQSSSKKIRKKKTSAISSKRLNMKVANTFHEENANSKKTHKNNANVNNTKKQSNGNKKLQKKHIHNTKKMQKSIQLSNKNQKHKQKLATDKHEKDFSEDLVDRLKASRFGFINEELYTTTGDEAIKVFNQDDSAFKTYHEGYRKQVEQWPLNPLDRIINSVKKLLVWCIVHSIHDLSQNFY